VKAPTRQAIVPGVSTPLPSSLSPHPFFLADDEDAAAGEDLSGQIWQHFHIYLEPHDTN